MSATKQKQKLFCLTIVSAALIFFTLVAEIALRFLTAFPVTNVSNRIPDPDFGYRLSPRLLDVDANGFRNAKTVLLESLNVLAVGDSHTYGNNVASEDSWPAVLAKETGLNVYNSGVGSYGIATYHALLSRYMQNSSKLLAIVAVYPNNDFAVASSFCEIDFTDHYWSRELLRLKLNLGDFQNGCRRSDKRDGGLDNWIRDNSAICSAVNELILVPLRVARRST